MPYPYTATVPMWKVLAVTFIAPWRLLLKCTHGNIPLAIGIILFVVIVAILDVRHSRKGVKESESD